MRSAQNAHGAPDPKHFASLGVALCLALAGVGVALIAARAHHGTNDTLLPLDGPAQQELRDGWRELGTLAASFPPAIPSIASPPPPAPATPPPGPARSSAAAQTAGDGLGGNGGESGNGSVGGGNNPAPRPIEKAPSATINRAPPGAQPLPSARSAPANPAFNFSSQSALCGPNTCNLGQVCCNPSCGTCVAPGATCDLKHCDNGIRYPASQSCGLATCNEDSVCCNPSCGICAAPGAECPQRACG